MVFLVLFSSRGIGQSTQITCLQTVNNEDIVINWNSPGIPSSQFVAYHLYDAINSAAPFSLLASVNSINTLSYTLDNAAALSSDFCFYVQLEYLVGGIPTLAPPSEIVCTMFLDVSPSSAPQGLALIDWQNPFPNIANGGNYTLTMEYDGIVSTIATLPQGTTFFSQEISVCNAVLNFQVTYQAPGGCTHISNIAGELLTDLTPPAIPLITSVSIDHTTNDAVISWEPSASPDTQGYIVYRCNPNGVTTLIDTVFGYNNTQFIDIIANTAAGPVSYLLAAIDTCYSGVPPSPNTSPAADICNKSVFLPSIAYGVCEDFVEVNWSAFEGWTNGVNSYEVFHRFGTEPFTLIAVVPPDQLSYNHLVPVGGINSYYVRAVSEPMGAASQTYFSISNLQNVNVVYPASPAYNYINVVTVAEKNKIDISILTQGLGTEHVYSIERRKVGSSDWDEITVLTNTTGSELFYRDSLGVDTDFFTYDYRAIVTNVCGDIVDTTEISTSVLLSGFAYGSRQVNALQWSDYTGWIGGVLEYRIIRRKGLEGPEELIETLPGTINYYEDDVSSLTQSPGDFFYLIECVSNSTTDFPDNFLARSNEIRLSMDPVIWVPNAFVIDGFNNTFGPIISFANFDEYRMIIYSRWGDVMYDTTDINAPWDGFMNGEKVQEGTYVYFITIEDGKGKPIERRGTVTLLSRRDE